jgi:hypothetical protein
MMQQAIVAVIVFYAAWVVVRRYAPKALKREVRAIAAHGLRKCGWERAARRLENDAQAAASCRDGCGSCGGCDSKEPAALQGEFAITPETLRRTTRR